MNRINIISNDVFALLDRDIEKKMMNWDGSNVQSFIDDLSTDDFGEMGAWSENHAFGSIDSELFGEENLTSEAKRLIFGKFISDCLMMVTQGQIACDTSNQKELVSHFYNLWMAVNGAANERS